MKAPEICSSTRKERLDFIRKEYRCLAICDLCGKCQRLHYQKAEIFFKDYIEDKIPYQNIVTDLN